MVTMKRLADTTTIVLGDPVFLRSVTTLLLAALLIIQSVVPCCAISNLLAGGDRSDAVTLQVRSALFMLYAFVAAAGACSVRRRPFTGWQVPVFAVDCCFIPL